MSDDLESKIEEAIRNPQNLGEMKDADAVGTVGSVDCGEGQQFKCRPCPPGAWPAEWCYF